MEQSKQIINSKSAIKPHKKKLLTKTTIAAGWLILFGITFIIVIAVVFGQETGDTYHEDDMLVAFIVLICILLSILAILSGIFLCLKKTWASIIALTMLSIGFVIFLSLCPSLYCLLSLAYLVPFILAISDLRNHWEVTSPRIPPSNKKASG